MILILLHPELDTGHVHNPLTSRIRHRTLSHTIYTPLYPHTILTYFIHLSYSQNPNSPHPPIILTRYLCLTSPVGVKPFFYWASPPSCLTHSGHTPSPWIALRMATWSYHHKPARKNDANLPWGVFELAIQALRCPRQDKDVTTSCRAMTPSYCLPYLSHFKTKYNGP